MENSKQLANRFREVLLNGKWVANTNFKDLLSTLDWKQATTKIGSLNTIAALAYHVNYYVAGSVHFFEKGVLEIRDKYSFDMPPIESKEDWENLLTDMWASAEAYAKQVESMSDEKLKEIFVDVKYGDYRRNIDGVIEHCYYHLGQVSLLKKLMTET